MNLPKDRDYKRERELAKKRGETGVGAMSGDNLRHKAQRKVESAIGRKLKENEVVDHKNPIKNGGSNSISNLKVTTRSKNAQHGGKIGNRKTKGNRTNH